MNPYAVTPIASDAVEVTVPFSRDELIDKTTCAVMAAGAVFGGSIACFMGVMLISNRGGITTTIFSDTCRAFFWLLFISGIGGICGALIAVICALLVVRLLYALAGPQRSQDGCVTGFKVLRFGVMCGFLSGGAWPWFLATLDLDITQALFGLIPATVGAIVTPLFLRKFSRQADQAISRQKGSANQE